MSQSQSSEKLNKLSKAYASPTWWYDVRGFFILKLSYNDSLLKQVAFFAKNTHGHHMEAAVGTGTLTMMIDMYNRFIRRKGRMKGIGFDYSVDMLSGAKTKLQNSHFEIIWADAADLKFDEGTFDSINLANALHCLPELEKSLKEFYRVLKSGGTFYSNVLLFPDEKKFLGRIAHRICDWGMKKGILYTPYNKEDILQRMTEAGFKIQEASRSGNSLNIVAMK